MIRNDRSVDVFVHKLRRKLERASPDWSYVHTHFGIGYRLAGEPADGAAVRELRPAAETTITSLAVDIAVSERFTFSQSTGSPARSAATAGANGSTHRCGQITSSGNFASAQWARNSASSLTSPSRRRTHPVAIGLQTATR